MTRPFLLFLLLVVPGQVVAQPLSSLPPSENNGRFFEDRFAQARPSLSVNGFSCQATGSCNLGLGLAEVLASSYGGDPAKERVLSHLLTWASRPLSTSPGSRGEIIDHTKMLQASAMVSLAGLLARQNGWVDGRPVGYSGPLSVLPEPENFLEKLRAVLAQPELVLPDPGLSDDAIKWSMSVTNLTRMVDLYLGLENAIAFYNVDAPLLACAEKLDLLDLLGEAATRLDDLGNLPVFVGIKRDEIQAGNWPMKTHVAVGYATLASQTETASGCGVLKEHSWDHWLQRAIRSAGATTGKNRSKHWHYQTGSGQPLFAEGPYYFHLALGEVVPFWHALRINGLLNAHSEVQPGDPFRADWFLAPLNWLADLAAPDGTTPPLDDGNREPLYRAALLGWSPSYGDAQTGARFAHWAGVVGMGLDTDLLPVEWAVPVATAATGPRTGLTSVGPSDRPQQLVVRHTTRDGARHWVLLNGERGDAITRGEGHEQADQMQLLYYVDGRSLLMDSGYDDALGVSNSSWNHYFDHNVLTVEGTANGEGGVEAPRPDLFSTRITASHADVSSLQGFQYGRVILLKASLDLFDGDLQTGRLARYDRLVLFVTDADSPYLIDINSGRAVSDSVRFVLRYHGNGDRIQEVRGASEWNRDGLRVQLLEPASTRIQPVADKARERQGEDVSIVTAEIRLPAARLGEDRRIVAVLSDADEPAPVFTGSGSGGIHLARLGSDVADVLILADAFPLVIDGVQIPVSLNDPDLPGFLRLSKASGVWSVVDGFNLNAELAGSTWAESSKVERTTPIAEVYPNPSSGGFRLRLDPSAHLEAIDVFDILGRALGTFRSVPDLESKNWLPGTYLLRVRLRDGRSETLKAIAGNP